MNRWPKFAIVLILILLAGAVRVENAEARTSPPTPLQLVPRPAHPSSPRMTAWWDSLEARESRRQWVASDSLATALLHQLEISPASDSIDLARALLFISSARYKRHLYTGGEAFTHVERAIGILERRGGEEALRLWGDALAAILYYDDGQPAASIEHAENVVRRLHAASAADTAMLAQVELSRGLSLASLGRNDEARAALERALALRAALDVDADRTLVPMLAEYGLFLSRLGEFDVAREHLQHAIRISEAGGRDGTDYLEGSLSRLSTLEDRVGNLAESIDLAQRAYELARNRMGEASTAALRPHTVVAYRMQELGDHRTAAALLRDIVPRLEIALGPRNPQMLNARLALIGSLIAIDDTTAAGGELAAVRAALVGQEALVNQNASNLLKLIAQLEHVRGHDAAARETLALAIRTVRERNDPLGTSLADLLTDQLNLLHGPADRERVERAAHDVDRLRDSTRVRAAAEWITLLAARAGAETRVGLRDAAWRDALEAERLARDRLGYQLEALPDAHALLLAQQLGTPCDLLVRIARADHPGDLATAWDRIVRWRGLVRHEIARRRPPASAASDTAVAAARVRWLAAQRRLGQLVVSGAAHPDDPASARRFQAARDEAANAERLYVRAAGGSVAAEEPPSLSRVLDRLGPGQALVAFAVGSTGLADETLGAFVATAVDRTPRFVPLGSVATIEPEVRAWVRLMGRPPASAASARRAEQECRALGRRVRARLWDPIARRTGAAREVIVVPEGPVSGLPWLALPDAASGYVADGATVFRELNAERDLIPAPETRGGSGLLAVGAPDYDRADSTTTPELFAASLLRARRWPCAGERPITLPDLPATRVEVEEIARRWPVEGGGALRLIGKEASELRFKREAPGRAVIHVATHGVVVEDTCGAAPVAGLRGIGGLSPVTFAPASARPAEAAHARPGADWLGRQVWLALAGANRPPSESGDENEGLLTAEEIVTLDLTGTDWVVLSACHSGLGAAWAREGVLGMRRAFHLAGARAVIASQWPVGDESTREWMAALYQGRARRDAAGAAVGHACRAVLAARRHDGRPTHPFYWAAFTATGD